MRAPDRWPPPEGTRTATIAGLVLALAIVVGIIWFIATYSQAEPPTPPPGEVPEAVRPEQ